MKLIIGRAGSGKTKKVAELAVELGEQGKRVLVLSDEYGIDSFATRLKGIPHTEALHYSAIVFHQVRDQDDAAWTVDTYPVDMDAFILDIRTTGATILNQLNKIEAGIKGDIYVVVQANRKANVTGIQIVDYEGGELNGSRVQ